MIDKTTINPHDEDATFKLVDDPITEECNFNDAEMLEWIHKTFWKRLGK